MRMLLLRRISLVISCAYLLHDSASCWLSRSHVRPFALLFIFARLLLLLFIFCLSFLTYSLSLSLSALFVAFEKFMHVLAYL